MKWSADTRRSTRCYASGAKAYFTAQIGPESAFARRDPSQRNGNIVTLLVNVFHGSHRSSLPS